MILTPLSDKSAKEQSDDSNVHALDRLPLASSATTRACRFLAGSDPIAGAACRKPETDSVNRVVIVVADWNRLRKSRDRNMFSRCETMDAIVLPLMCWAGTWSNSHGNRKNSFHARVAC